MKTRSEQARKEVFSLKAQWQQKPIKVKWAVGGGWPKTVTVKPDHAVTVSSWTANSRLIRRAENTGHVHSAEAATFADCLERQQRRGT